MRACSGTWIAHGGGSADREAVDAEDHVRVPPETPEYRIRRVWLTQEEEQGYYYGFANEGLWPLCHIAHTRPTFRPAGLAALPHGESALRRRGVQGGAHRGPDRACAGLPLRAAAAHDPRGAARRDVISFWHIPWPNPEAFGILPWREALLEGMLGSSILGFHTQFHCNNFLDTVDRYLEARVDRETFTISFGGQQTEVHRYPISIEWPPASTRGRCAGRRTAGGACAKISGCHRTSASASAWTGSTTPRVFWSVSTPSSGCSNSNRPGSAASRSCRRRLLHAP